MKKNTILLTILLAVHLYLLANLRFTAWPEMFSFAYLRNNGFLLYRDMIHPYPPVLTMGISLVYSIFGYNLNVLKIITWLMILANDALIFLIADMLTKSKRAALLALGFYVFLQPFLEGNQLWFDLALVTPILLGTLFLVRGKTKQNIFLAGLFFGVATLTKQTAGLFLVLSILYPIFRGKNLFIAGLFFGVAALIKQTAGLYIVLSLLYLVYKGRHLKNATYLLVGPIILFIPLLIRLYQERALAEFFKWTLIYPLTFWSKFPGYVQMDLSNNDIVTLLILIVPILLFLFRSKVQLITDKKLQILLLFLTASLLIIYPRFSFFHFQAALAFLAILFGYLLQKIKINYLLLVAYLFFLTFIIHRPVLARDWQKEARFYGQRDFELAQIISEKVQVDEKVFFLGLHSGHYVLANRLPPEPWVDNFGWYFEVPGVQEWVLSGWKQDPPTAIFWQDPEPGNWFEPGTYQPGKITKWIEDNYTEDEEVKSGVWIWKRKG